MRDGQKVSAGHAAGQDAARRVGGTQDITGGLPRVTEIFEARRPRDPAVMAEMAGRVRLGEKKQRQALDLSSSRSTTTASRSARRSEHLVPHGKHLRVHTGDYVKEGDPLVIGPLVPHDILRISGIEAVQNYLVREVQSVYRSQRVDIDDKHIEIIVSQMLRKVKVETMGDTGLLPGSVIDKFAFREVNDRLQEVRQDQGPGRLEVRGRQDRQQGSVRGGAGRAWKSRTRSRRPSMPPDAGDVQRRSCWASPRRRCSPTASSRRRRFQETTKVLTEAALAGKVDYLVGLKENVILGHLVPAGTGFHMHQDAEVRITPEGPGGDGRAAAGCAGCGGRAAGGDGGGVRIGRTVKTDLSRCKPFLEVGLATLDEIELFHGPFELA